MPKNGGVRNGFQALLRADFLNGRKSNHKRTPPEALCLAGSSSDLRCLDNNHGSYRNTVYREKSIKKHFVSEQGWKMRPWAGVTDIRDSFRRKVEARAAARARTQEIENLLSRIVQQANAHFKRSGFLGDQSSISFVSGYRNALWELVEAVLAHAENVSRLIAGQPIEIDERAYAHPHLNVMFCNKGRIDEILNQSNAVRNFLQRNPHIDTCHAMMWVSMEIKTVFGVGRLENDMLARDVARRQVSFKGHAVMHPGEGVDGMRQETLAHLLRRCTEYVAGKSVAPYFEARPKGALASQDALEGLKKALEGLEHILSVQEEELRVNSMGVVLEGAEAANAPGVSLRKVVIGGRSMGVPVPLSVPKHRIVMDTGMDLDRAMVYL